MNTIKFLPILIFTLFYLIGCLPMNSSKVSSNDDPDIHVYIYSNLKKMYVSTPLDTDSIRVCINEHKNDCDIDDSVSETDHDSESDSVSTDETTTTTTTNNNNSSNNNKISKIFGKVEDRYIFEFSSEEDLKNFNILRFDKDGNIITKRKSNLTIQNSDDKYAPNPQGVSLSKAELDMIVAVNKYREQNNLRILKVDKLLMEEARVKVKKMLPYVGQYSSTPQWMHSLSHHSGSENIFLNPRTVEDAMRGFKHSSDHNGNMLSSSHSTIGVGAIFSDSGYGCWAQNMR